MMDNFVFSVDFENESIVNCIFSEYLYVYTGCHYNED